MAKASSTSPEHDLIVDFITRNRNRIPDEYAEDKWLSLHEIMTLSGMPEHRIAVMARMVDVMEDAIEKGLRTGGVTKAPGISVLMAMMFGYELGLEDATKAPVEAT